MNKHKELKDYYGPDFYRNRDGSLRSAQIILSILYKLYQPLSVVDIGCGLGSWLAAAESLGSRKLKGFDGSWVNKDNLLSKNIDFTAVDINKNELELKEKYDLCISLEVAEHLPGAYSDRFVERLCQASDIILFSAAIKYQGGIQHINEQRQSYWIKLFDSNGYKCLDIFRPVIWENNAVEWWYRQNIFLFVNRLPESGSVNNLGNAMLCPIADIVHPENYENKCVNLENLQKQMKYPTIRFILRSINRYFLNKRYIFSRKCLL
jgi:SAM-dependent methyltransferase